jgi:hypothetical protein
MIIFIILGDIFPLCIYVYLYRICYQDVYKCCWKSIWHTASSAGIVEISWLPLLIQNFITDCCMSDGFIYGS